VFDVRYKISIQFPSRVGVGHAKLSGGREAEDLEETNREQSPRTGATVVRAVRGGAPGNDEANWLQAEAEILRYNMEVRESGTWLSLKASNPRRFRSRMADCCESKARARVRNANQ